MLSTTVHDSGVEELRRSWFVVFTPPDGERGHIGLVAVEVGDDEWRAVWTETPECVARMDRYVRRAFE